MRYVGSETCEFIVTVCASPPGASRRLLSMRFCELLNKEVEYIAISQDTTESDLKQVLDHLPNRVRFKRACHHADLSSLCCLDLPSC